MKFHTYGENGVCTWCEHHISNPGTLICLGASEPNGSDVKAVLFEVAKTAFVKHDMSRDKFVELATEAYLRVEQGM